MYKTYTLNRKTGALVALNARKQSDATVLSVNHDVRATSLHQPDFNEMSDDPDEFLQVLSTKIQRLCQQRANGATGTYFEADVRDVLASATRLFNKVIGRKSVT
jgi:hypothetical protein